MNQFIICLLSGIFVFQQANCQDSPGPLNQADSSRKQVFYRAYIYSYDRSSAIKGYLAAIQDSAVIISQTKLPLSFEPTNLYYLGKIKYGNIEEIKVIRAKVVGRSLLIGALVGIAAGALIGYASGSDHGLFALDAGGKAVLGAFIGAGAGLTVVAIIGHSSEKKFEINGEWKSLEEMKASLRKNE